MADFDEPFVGDSQPTNESEESYSQVNGSANAMNIDYDEGDIDLSMDEDGDRIPIAALEFSNGVGQGTIEIKIFAGEEIRIGREDSSYCQWIIADPRVSKKQFRIYSIVYDPTNMDEIQPLVYCEDLESTNGTFVNNHCIGKFGMERRGHLLIDGDVIKIKPHWRYRFRQFDNSDPGSALGNPADIEHFNDQYDITERLLGTGQYGKVYLARERSTSRQLACKIVDLNNTREEIPSESWTERCRRAAEDRPHIVELRKAFVSNNFIYIFTELAPAGDLFSYCDSHGGKVSDTEGRVICQQIILALQYIHEKNIAHRDIKMENVLIMQIYDFSCRVVLTDFGFANDVDPKSRRMKSRVGTTGYVAPEVEAADRVAGGYTLAADMWSLGVLTFNMLVGDSAVPRNEYSQQSQQNVDKFLQDKDCRELTARARRFLLDLLAEDPTKRMTASEALQHSWFKKPLKEGVAIEDACKRISRYWKPREDCGNVIEDLPDRIAALQKDSIIHAEQKIRKRVPDMNPFPYTGLEHHLNPRTQSSRGLILNGLKEKEAFFVTEANETASASNPRPRQETTKIRQVPAEDLFGTSSKKSLSSDSYSATDYGYESDEDNLSLVPTYSREYKLQGAFQETSENSSNQGVLKADQTENIGSKLPRAQLAYMNLRAAEEKRAREDVSRQVPRHSNAKAYGDAVRKMMSHTNPASTAS